MEQLTAIEHATLSFYQWEERGRGYMVYPFPVALEPVLEPFIIQPYQAPPTNYKDPGERTSVFDALKGGVKSLLDPKKPVVIPNEEERTYSYPNKPIPFTNNQALVGYRVSAPHGFEVHLEESLRFLNMLSYSQAPFSFEIIGTTEKIDIQYVVREYDSGNFLSQFRSYFPNVAIEEVQASDLPFVQDHDLAIVDMGLQKEFMCPINTVQRFAPDPLIGIMASLEQLQYDEVGMIQILFRGSINAWASTITEAVSDGSGGSFFEDAPEFVKLAQEKTSSPLYGCVVRVIGQGNVNWRSEQIASDMFRNISATTRSQNNQLIALSNKGYLYQQHVNNVYQRQSNRLGMLLNSNELISLVHIPSASVTSQKLSRQAVKSKLAPKELLKGKYLLGTNTHLGQSHSIYLGDEYKKRHIYCIGNTGQGKSTLIVNMLLNDCEVGNGCALFDPHGDVVDDLVSRIPNHRRKDVILFDPSDTEYPIGFNLLEAKTDIERIVLSSDLVEVFKARSTSWGDQMTSVLSNAINAFLENEQGGTLLELRRFLLDAKFRAKYLNNVQDYSIRSYWEHDFKQLRKGAISPLLTRLDTFLRPRIVRNMMAQKKGIDFGEVMNGKKILLVKLSQGLIGEENSYLLGTLILSKLQQAAQARANLSKEQRNPYYVYIDEFHNFITPSMTQILSGARKYGLGLFLANQQISQLSSVSSAVADSVLSNPAVRMCFRVGDNDARTLAQGFSYYEQQDLQNLSRGQCIVRVGSNTNDFNLVTNMFEEAPHADASRSEIVSVTRNNYASTKEEVEQIVQEISQFKLPVETKQTTTEIPEKQSYQPKEILPTKKVLETINEPDDFQEQADKYVQHHEEQREQKEHQYLQEYLSRLAQQRGCKTQVEVPTNDGGRIDLLVEKDDIQIAVEISVTNTVDYEVQNLKKCIKAGFAHILMLCKSDAHLRNIRLKAQEVLNEKKFKMIEFAHPDSFVEYIETKTAKNTSTEKRVRGYRVKANYNTSTNLDAKKQELKKIILKKKI